MILYTLEHKCNNYNNIAFGDIIFKVGVKLINVLYGCAHRDQHKVTTGICVLK